MLLNNKIIIKMNDKIISYLFHDTVYWGKNVTYLNISLDEAFNDYEKVGIRYSFDNWKTYQETESKKDNYNEAIYDIDIDKIKKYICGENIYKKDLDKDFFHKIPELNISNNFNFKINLDSEQVKKNTFSFALFMEKNNLVTWDNNKCQNYTINIDNLSQKYSLAFKNMLKFMIKMIKF